MLQSLCEGIRYYNSRTPFLSKLVLRLLGVYQVFQFGYPAVINGYTIFKYPYLEAQSKSAWDELYRQFTFQLMMVFLIFFVLIVVPGLLWRALVLLNPFKKK